MFPESELGTRGGCEVGLFLLSQDVAEPLKPRAGATGAAADAGPTVSCPVRTPHGVACQTGTLGFGPGAFFLATHKGLCRVG